MNSEIWLPIATLIIGAGLGYVAEWHRDRQAADRERTERRNAFQRDTITELQGLAWVAYQASVADLYEMRRVAASTGHWPNLDSPIVSRERGEQDLATVTRLRLVATWTTDDELRLDGLAIHQLNAKLFAAPNETMGAQILEDIGECVDRIDDRVRIVLNKLY